MTEETEVRSPEPRAVSLDLELSTIASATRGAAILADLETRQGLLDEEMEEDTPVSIMAILALVGERIDQLRRVIRGEEDPGHFRSPHNAISLPESLDEVDGDIVLFPWNTHGMPLVLARPTGWGLTPEEREARKAMDLGGRPGKALKGAEPKGAKGAEPKGAKGAELVPEPPSVPGEEPKDPPPSPKSH